MAGEGYIQLPLIGDVDTLTQVGTDYLTSSMGPNWVMRPANPETVLIEGSGQIAAELLDQAATVPPEAFAYIGISIYNIPMYAGARAVMAATITFDDNAAPARVPQDSEISVPHSSGDGFIFTTDRDADAPVGGGDVVVNLVALDIGAEPNGAGGSSDLVDVVGGVTSIVANIATGGVDAEDVSTYLNRLTRTLTMPRRPVLPDDFVTLALDVPGVGKASVFNLYYPGTTARDAGMAIGSYARWTPPPAPAAAANGVARCTTVAITDADGGIPSDALMAAVLASMEANREVTFLSFVVKPTFTSIDVQTHIVPYSGVTQADAEAAAEDMIRTWLPEAWNTNPGVTDNVWNADTKVRLYEAVDYLNRATGVWYVENVKMKLTSQSVASWVAADIVLPGVAPIPTAGTVEFV